MFNQNVPEKKQYNKNSRKSPLCQSIPVPEVFGRVGSEGGAAARLAVLAVGAAGEVQQPVLLKGELRLAQAGALAALVHRTYSLKDNIY